MKPQDIIKRFRAYYFIIFFLIAGSLSRFFWLGRENLWFDEVRGMEIAAEAPSIHPENFVFFSSWESTHPIFYYWIHYHWMELFGRSEAAVRSLSALCGVLLIVAVYLAGKNAISRKAGVLAAILLLVNPVALYYSQEARMYSLDQLLTLVSTYYFYRLLQLRRTRYFILYVLSSVLLLYTDYLGTLTLFAHLVFFFFYLLRSKEKKANLISAVGFALIALLYIPWLPNALSGLYWDKLGWMRPPALLQVISDTLAQMGVISTHIYPPQLMSILSVSGPGDLLYLLPAAWAAAILVTGYTVSLKKFSAFTGLVAIVGAVPILIYLISLFVVPVYHLRHASVHYPETALVMAVGFLAAESFIRRRLKAWPSRAALFILLLPVLAANSYWSYRVYAEDTKEHWRRIASDSEEKRDGRSLVICNAHLKAPFRYYYRGAAPIIPIRRQRFTDLPALVQEKEFLLLLGAFPGRERMLKQLEDYFDFEYLGRYVEVKLFSVRRK